MEKSTYKFREKHNTTILGRKLSVAKPDSVLFNEYKSEGLCDIFATVFAVRNLKPEKRLLSPKFAEILGRYNKEFLPSSYDLFDAINAVKQASQRIAIFGDYDVDGMTSAMIAYKWFTDINIESKIFYSKRELGYGIHNVIIDEIVADNDYEFLIILDCGTSSFHQIQYAQTKGLKVIVIDHHMPPDDIAKPDIIINPHVYGCDESLQSMCTGGLIYILAMHYCKRNNAKTSKDLLIFATIATVCDMVRLTDINRAIIRAGLLRISKSELSELPYFLQAVIAINNIQHKYFNTQDISFGIGPLLNAAGRISTIAACFSAMQAKNYDDAVAAVSRLKSINQERKKCERIAIKKVNYDMLKQESAAGVAIVVSNAHTGIIGILASRISKNIGLPTFVFSKKDKDTYSCSARSEIGNLSKLVHCAIDDGVIDSGGGHNAAAGFTIKHDKLEEFRNFANNFFDQFQGQIKCKVEYVLSGFGGIANKSISNYMKLAPFGIGFEEPVLMVADCIILSFRKYNTRGFEILCKGIKDSTTKAIKCKDFNIPDEYINKIERVYRESILIDIIGSIRIDIMNSSYDFLIHDLIIKDNMHKC